LNRLDDAEGQEGLGGFHSNQDQGWDKVQASVRHKLLQPRNVCKGPDPVVLNRGLCRC
jgi:hypothetical protein